MENLFAPVFVL